MVEYFCFVRAEIKSQTGHFEVLNLKNEDVFSTAVCWFTVAELILVFGSFGRSQPANNIRTYFQAKTTFNLDTIYRYRRNKSFKCQRASALSANI